MKKKILFVFGTRPEAIKMAPLVKEMQEQKASFDVKVCVTAQHRHMLDQVLDIFEIKADYDLNIMEKAQTLFHITSACLLGLEAVLKKEKPDLVLVHGDTTTSFAAALGAFYQKIPVGHVEAGLRSFDLDNPFPEEANRVLTDRICSLLFAPTPLSKNHLLKEGVSTKKISVTGNTVIDALFLALKKKHTVKNMPLLKFLNHKNSKCRIILVTAHRRENFGKPLENICTALRKTADNFKDIHIIYPVHLNPNVQKTVNTILAGHERILLIEPLDYLDLINLMKLSNIIVTDSGGIQEEAPALGKPVLVLRKVTERPEGIKAGTVKLTGTDKNKIIRELSLLLKSKKHYNKMAKAKNPYGDGKASRRIISSIKTFFNPKLKSTVKQFN
ncbi:MAG: UDP-N-acetylglucosamine 2-epimerase [Elusimicrobia bacterium RIFOXYA2_FULL_39_19]|nr:MAG: UDP-N-acetylglucosamine 2-epimerase [Elusimicrobia bacterium RIFOXYA2_FULL_39_19]